MKIKTTIYLGKECKDRLKQMAEKEDTNMSVMVDLLITEEYLKQDDFYVVPPGYYTADSSDISKDFVPHIPGI